MKYFWEKEQKQSKKNRQGQENQDKTIIKDLF